MDVQKPQNKEVYYQQNQRAFRDGTKAMTRVLCAGPQPWGLLFSAMMSLDSEPRLLFLVTTLYTDSLPILTVEGHQ